MENISHPESIISQLTDSARIRQNLNRAPLTLPASMPATLKPADLQVKINTPEQRQRRKHTRGVWEVFDAIARAIGLADLARHDAWVISCKLYERDGEACNTPRDLSTAAISSAMGCTQATARNRLGKLFNHEIPQAGYQVLTRFKAEEDSGERHKYATHLFPLAAAYAELYEAEKAKILFSKGLTRQEKGMKLAECLERLVQEAVTHLSKCDTELLDPDGKTYAYVSAPEASAFMVQKKSYAARPYKYAPPPEKPKKPLYSNDLRRRMDKIAKVIARELDEVSELMTFDGALRYSRQLKAVVLKGFDSWEKVERERGERGERRELIHVTEIVGGAAENAVLDPPPGPDTPPVLDAMTPTKFVGVSSDKSLDSSEIEKPVFEAAPEVSAPASEASAELDAATAPESAVLEPAINFDSSLEAAIFYARDGFPVLPVCQWDADAGRCTGEKHGPDCKGRKPLVKGDDGKDGYSAATLDQGKIRDWFTRLFPRAGVAARLDGKAAIDADPKDGGLESYAILRDTFALPETLTQITQGNGRHFVFKLPEGLPDGWLKSWVRIGNKVGLPGIDLKVDKNGLIFVEPTCGPKGVYRWIDPCQELATLPRECADFLHEARYKQTPEEKAKPKEGKPAASPSPLPQTLDKDQAKYFRDVAPGTGQHARLLKIGTRVRIKNSASAAEIADVMRWHASRFSTPLNDDDAEKWIQRAARSIERKYQGASS